MDFQRRKFLGAASATALLTLGLTTAKAFPLFKKHKILCFVGGYTKDGTAGVDGNGPGISTFEMDPVSGKLRFIRAFTDIVSPSFLVLSKDQKFLYALSEVNNFGKAKNSGSVTAFSVDQSTGELKKINTVFSQGGSPCHLSIHPTGKYIFVANYVGGTVAALPIKPDGSLSEATDVVHNSGPKMPERASDNPVGNFAISNHSGSHPHMVLAESSGDWVFVDDAGLDRIYLWRFDVNTGKLTAAKTPFFNLLPGAAPRHFVFNKDETIIYNLCEQDSKVVVSRFDKKAGTVTSVQNISTLIEGFQGSTLAAELLLSEDGRYLYVSNRLGDSITIFEVQEDGTLKFKKEAWAHADYGRAMEFDPTHNFLFVTNQRSDSITSFSINRVTGDLTFTNQFTAVGSPTTISFMLTKAV